MSYILCRKCQTGNAEYLSVCSHCGADLFGEDNAPETPPPGTEISAEKLRRNATIAVVVWVATTVFKVWFLYTLTASAHMKFPQLRDLFIFLWPVVASAITAAKYRRWYWPLIVDSIIMIIVFVIFFAIFIAAKIKGF